MALIPIQRAPLDFTRDVARGASSPTLPARAYRETRWYELAPAGWDPYREMAEMQRSAKRLSDADPRAQDMLRKVRDLWSNAPTNPAMEGAVVRIPGYVVPLEQDKRGLREFLLVPYFGACIHTPPPPANQIIDVKARVPLASVHSMDMVWVSGTLRTSRSETSMGAGSYALEADTVDPYQAPPR
jgi:hypothetical protein